MPFVAQGTTKRPVLDKLLSAALDDSQSLLTPAQPLQHLPGGQLLLTMKGHRDATSALAVSTLREEGTGVTLRLCIISASWDRTLKSWDLSTTGVLKTFDGHTDKVLSVALTTDGQYAASGSADMTVRLWYVPSAESVQVMCGHKAAVNAVVMTTNGTKTVSGSSDGTIKVWNTDVSSSSCGEMIFTMKRVQSPVLSMALFEDRLLALGAKNSVTLVMDIVSSKVVHKFKVQDDPSSALFMVQVEGENYLLTGSRSGRVCVRKLESGKLVHSLRQSDNASCVHSIAVSGTGKVIASHENGLLSAWDLHSGHHLYNFTSSQNPALGVALADEGNLLVTGCGDSSLQIWDLLSPPQLQNRQHENCATSVSISPCGTYGVSGGEDSKLKLYDLHTGSIVGEIETGTRGVTCVSVLRDSERILVAYRNGSMEMWSGVTQERLVRFEGRGGAINCIAISLDSSLVMSGGEDAIVAFWSAKSGAKLKEFRNHSTAVVGVNFSQDSMTSASRDGQVCIRDYKTARVLVTCTTHDELLCLAVSPNAAFFVTGSRDKTCHVVHLRTGELKYVLRGHRSSVTCLKVLSNCMRCLTGSEDGYLRIWDMTDGSCVAELRTDAPLTSCDISWKSDHVLYGTKGGWVSGAVYKDTDNLQQRSKFTTSDSSMAESESTGDVEGTSHEEKDGNVEVSSCHGQTHHRLTVEEAEQHTEVQESVEFVAKSYPIDVTVMVTTRGKHVVDVGATKRKDAVWGLNGFAAPSTDPLEAAELHTEEALQASKESLRIETLPASKEHLRIESSKESLRIELLEYEAKAENTEQGKATSSTCLIL